MTNREAAYFIRWMKIINSYGKHRKYSYRPIRNVGKGMAILVTNHDFDDQYVVKDYPDIIGDPWST